MAENENKWNVNEIVQNLKTWRDELNVQAHLMKADMKDEWNELEQKWDELVKSAKELEPEISENVQEAKTALQEHATKISKQLSESYSKIKESLWTAGVKLESNTVKKLQ